MPIDPAQRESIRDDLRGIVRGDLLFDELNRALYSTDASIFQIEPLGVIAPRDEEDLQGVVRYAAGQSVPLIARGAGTGLAGESLGDGLILDLSRHFRQILEVGPDWVRVQPGVVLQHLNQRLAQDGRRFAPDPASGATCTIGGMLATDASGSRSLKYGFTRDHVLSCRVVLDTGEAVRVGHELLPPPPEQAPRLREIVQATGALLRRRRNAVQDAQPKTAWNRCGYRLHDVLGQDTLDLPRLLCGSEGTLALIAEATLRTVPLPGGRGAALLCFAGRDAALRAVQIALPHGPSACELLDRRLVTLARAAHPDSMALLPNTTEGALLVEFEAETPAEARLVVQSFIDQAGKQERFLQARAAWEHEDVERFWRLRDTALPALFGLTHGAKPISFIEDIGVPPESLGTFLARVQDVLQRNDVVASFLTHAATGQVHIRPFLDLNKPEDTARLRPLADAVYALVLEMGGTISAQHGVGLARTPWMEQQYRSIHPILRQVKAIFDPQHLFNPGKIIGGPVSAWPLRMRPKSQRSSVDTEQPLINGSPAPAVNGGNGSGSMPLALVWTQEEVEEQVQACNGCGHCRSEIVPTRMCPMFRVRHTEAATPRAKANLLRHVLADADPLRLAVDDVREIADLCINCRMCAVECPARVSIPKLMLEAKAAYHAEHGLDRVDWVLARTEEFAALGSRFAPAINPLLESRPARWLLERLFGVSRRRHLPPFARQSFLRLAHKRGLTRKPRARSSGGAPRVAYFVDVFANYNDPQIAVATVAVLRHNGVEVFVPPDQIGCGMASLAQGDVESAREFAVHNLRALAELAREGWAIVCSEPTAALMLGQDYRDLIGDVDAKLVAEQTVELTSFLADLHEQGRLRTDFQPVGLGVGHHVPCHLKALGRPAAAPRLLALIPELRVHTIDVSCSGMAGTFGLKRRNYWASLEAGKPMLEELRRPRVLVGSSECSACRMQMEQGSGKRALHPVQYIALAYGLLPDVARRLRTPMPNGSSP
jgi:FAD/FMN-containing dehydrogenase/Fe-S oxidoreductase